MIKPNTLADKYRKEKLIREIDGINGMVKIYRKQLSYPNLLNNKNYNKLVKRLDKKTKLLNNLQQ